MINLVNSRSQIVGEQQIQRTKHFMHRFYAQILFEFKSHMHFYTFLGLKNQVLNFLIVLSSEALFSYKTFSY